MTPLSWPCPAPGGTGEEFALVAGPRHAERCVLIVPALFEEANRTRRLIAETMRTLAQRGVATVLPDLPGCGESLAPLDRQTLASWRAAVIAAVAHFETTHVLAVRGGALLAPSDRPGWRLAPTTSVLKPLLRARVVAAREEGREETTAALLESGSRDGLDLAGYRLGAAMVRDLAEVEASAAPGQIELALDELGGSALWLRSEPGEDQHLAAALAAKIAQ